MSNKEPTQKETNEYFNSIQGDLSSIENEDLKCKDCENKLSVVASCVIYQECKPLEVLEGGDCEYYDREQC